MMAAPQESLKTLTEVRNMSKGRSIASIAPTMTSTSGPRRFTVAYPFTNVCLRGRNPEPEGYPRELKTVGDHIRKRRMDLELLQREVAAEIGVHVKTLSLWELRGTTPTIRQWPGIILFLGYDPEGEPETLADLLQTARRRLGYSHRRLGEALGVDPSTIYKWERGEIPRNVRSWQRLEPMFEELGIGLEIRCALWPKR
jgi:transcriptional regulator with XRE-family HTH domain